MKAAREWIAATATYIKKAHAIKRLQEQGIKKTILRLCQTFYAEIFLYEIIPVFAKLKSLHTCTVIKIIDGYKPIYRLFKVVIFYANTTGSGTCFILAGALRLNHP